MGILAETVRFEGEKMSVGLSDGRVIGNHWAALDEDVSVEGPRAGRGDRRRVGGEAA